MRFHEWLKISPSKENNSPFADCIQIQTLHKVSPVIVYIVKIPHYQPCCMVLYPYKIRFIQRRTSKQISCAQLLYDKIKKNIAGRGARADQAD